MLNYWQLPLHQIVSKLSRYIYVRFIYEMYACFVYEICIKNIITDANMTLRLMKLSVNSIVLLTIVCLEQKT